MRYTITGAHRETGQDSILTLAAKSIDEARHMATQQGILVAHVRPTSTVGNDDGTSALPLWEEDAGTAPGAAQALSTTLLGNNAPPAPTTTTTTTTATTPTTPTTPTAAPTTELATGQYHVVQNPSLYLLETAVNKQIREGWEPVGGIQVNNWNNQILFYQAMVRRRPNPQG